MVEIYVSGNIGPITISKYLSWPFHELLWSITPFVLSWSAFFPVIADFPNCPKGSVTHLRWSHSHVSRQRMQIAIGNQSGDHANHYSACNYFFQVCDSQVKHNTIARLSDLYHGDPYTGKTASSYWNGSWFSSAGALLLTRINFYPSVDK